MMKLSGLTYEWKLILVLAVLFGLVGLDRFVVVYLFPVIIPELGLSNMQAGMIASVLALTWAFSSWILGSLSDRYGRKPVLLASVVFFSLMTSLTALAKGFASMLLVRGLLGVGEGGVYSTSAATVAGLTKGTDRGLKLGVHQAIFPLLGIGLGPIIATQLNSIMPWEAVFVVLGIPGLIIAYILKRMMKESPSIVGTYDQANSSALSVLRYRNIWVSTLVSCFFQTGLFVFSTFVALYLTREAGFSLEGAGAIISGWGFGGFFGMIGIPALSDRYGRKPVLICCSAVYASLMLTFALVTLPPVAMFLLLFISGVVGFGLAPLFLTIIPCESVPEKLAGSACGVPVCIGELIGGVVMPVVAGGLADQFGLQIPMIMVGCAFGVIAIISFGFVETVRKYPEIEDAIAPANL